MDLFGSFATTTNVLFCLASSVLLWASYKLLIDPWLSPLRSLPEARGNSRFIMGHTAYIFSRPAGEVFETWIKRYGPTLQYKSLFRRRRLLTVDPRALSHILNNADKYEKPAYINKGIEGVFGKNNILSLEGAEHRRARAILSPCFTHGHLKNMVPNMYAKAFMLRDILKARGHRQSTSIDVFSWLSRCTLDIIMSNAFDYEFHSMTEGEQNPVAQAFANGFGTDGSFTLLSLLQTLYKPFRLIPNKASEKVRSSRELYHRHAARFLQKKQEDIAASDLSEKGVWKAAPDTLTALLRAKTLATPTDGLSDEEILSHITLLMSAGHETVAITLSWLLHDLAIPCNKDVQQRLRAELSTIPSDEPSIEDLNALPYLEAVGREALRLHPAVMFTVREAVEDDIVPLRWPVLVGGVPQDQVRLRKGDDVMISMVAINRDKRLWGEDAHAFRPDRWLQETTFKASPDTFGMYANLMTFLGGSRNCIGYKVALLEIKIIVFTLLRHLTFAVDPAVRIGTKHGVLLKPFSTDESGSTQVGLPLLVETVSSCEFENEKGVVSGLHDHTSLTGAAV